MKDGVSPIANPVIRQTLKQLFGMAVFPFIFHTSANTFLRGCFRTENTVNNPEGKTFLRITFLPNVKIRLEYFNLFGDLLTINELHGRVSRFLAL